MATSTNASNCPGQDKGPVDMVTLPIVDTDNVPWTRLLDQPGITFQSIPVVGLDGQPITVNVNTINSHIQVPASGITRLSSSGVPNRHITGEVAKSLGTSYSVTSTHLSSVFSESLVPVNIVSTQDSLPSNSCMLEFDSYPDHETAFPNVDEPSSKDSHLLQDSGLLKPITEEIFSNIQAFLSDTVLDAILNTKSSFLEDLQTGNNLVWHKEANAWCFSGKLLELLGLHRKLLALLKGSRIGSCGEEDSTADKSTQTNPTSTADFSATCDILVPTVSAFGRGIRQPARLNQYSFVTDDGPEEEKPKRPRRKRKADHVYRHINPVEQVNYYLPGGKSKQQHPVSREHRESDKGRENLQPSEDGEAKSSNGYSENEDVTNIPKKKTRKDYETLAPYKYFCKLCSFKSKRESHFAKHMKLHTSSTEIYECKQCDFKTIRSSTLKCHEVCHSKFLFSCDHCKYRSTSLVLLSKHIKVKHRQASDKSPHPRNVVYLRCQQCPFKTVSAQKFAQHLKSHGTSAAIAEETAKLLQKEEETLTTELFCKDCNYKTTRKEHLARHRNNVHSDIRPYLCDLCGCSFKRADTLTAHKVTHVDKKYRLYQYKCKECDKDFRSRAHLSEHMAMHSSLRMYLCDICGVGFKRKSCQQKHMKSIHLNPRSFQCRDCTKSFNTKYALLRHARTHDIAIPNQVHQEISLQQIQITHNFQCSECEKTFDTKYLLLRHMQTHDPSIQIPEVQESLPQIESQIATFETLDEQALEGQTQELSVQDIITGGQVLEEYHQSNLSNNEAAMATIYLTNPLPLNLSPVLPEQGSFK
ncbi:uncharacterized protein [Argopecten irradians]|uniref:uncharacterized protein n=1 Tax=Argopecten irradians TaxID=31199 RepID=UPI00371CDE08